MEKRYLVILIIGLIFISAVLYVCIVKQKELDNNKNISSVEEYNQLEKKYQKIYPVTGFISELDTRCYCPIDDRCGLCPITPYLILTDYKVEFHDWDKYDVSNLNYNELYIILRGVEDISGLELDGKYIMNVRFVENKRVYLESYERT